MQPAGLAIKKPFRTVPVERLYPWPLLLRELQASENDLQRYEVGARSKGWLLDEVSAASPSPHRPHKDRVTKMFEDLFLRPLVSLHRNDATSPSNANANACAHVLLQSAAAKPTDADGTTTIGCGAGVGAPPPKKPAPSPPATASWCERFLDEADFGEGVGCEGCALVCFLRWIRSAGDFSFPLEKTRNSACVALPRLRALLSSPTFVLLCEVYRAHKRHMGIDRCRHPC